MLGTYNKAESLGLVGESILYAEKLNGECGFLVDGREIGFDKTFADKPKEVVVCYNIAFLGKSTYYVKQYFESKEVHDQVGEVYAGIGAEGIKEKLNKKQCEFIFYNETGSVLDINLLIKEYGQAEKDKEEQKKKDVQAIAELRQTAASQLPIRDSDKKIYFYGDDEYVNTGYMVKYQKSENIADQVGEHKKYFEKGTERHKQESTDQSAENKILGIPNYAAQVWLLHDKNVKTGKQTLCC